MGNAAELKNPSALKLEVEPNGVAVLTLDMPGAAVNTLNVELGAELKRLIAEIEADQEIKAVVFTVAMLAGMAVFTLLERRARSAVAADA